jgi:Uri superfamily endonuclease
LIEKDTISLPPSEPGTYTLILEISESIIITVGALGAKYFPKGLYTYTGSALGLSQNLKTRIARHLRRVKRRRWHIDYLLEDARIVCVAYCVNSSRLECCVAKALKETEGAMVIVRGFGASDCSCGCLAHLYYHSDLNLDRLAKIVSQTYSEFRCNTGFLEIGENDYVQNLT